MRRRLLMAVVLGIGLISISASVDLNALFNYANQTRPNFINKDNSTAGNLNISDEGATLGRVLFYDKKLSVTNTVACASCHIQEYGFSDTAVQSVGINGVTPRHSMRLINNRFGVEVAYFWDERAANLRTQTSMPIHDHIEMGYSGQNGDPDFQDLVNKLSGLNYYKHLFHLAFGDTTINLVRVQSALAQFVASIESFDSKFDQGLAQAPNLRAPFPNFTQQENQGKMLFLGPPQFDANGVRTGGGLGCQGCHGAPEFDIAPNSQSNGVIFAAGSVGVPTALDTFITKAPSLRNLFNPQNQLNGPMMHNGNFSDLNSVLGHYDSIRVPAALSFLLPRIDNRLRPGGNPQRLRMTNQEKQALIDFLHTLTGSAVYTNPKWSNPFDANGEIEILNSPLAIQDNATHSLIQIFPNPFVDQLSITNIQDKIQAEVYDNQGRLLGLEKLQNGNALLDLSDYSTGNYIIALRKENGSIIKSQKVLKK